MTAKPEPDKLGRNMKALPSAMWNRAIPENDYIQLGTLRYGVRLSNAGLLDAGKSGHVVDLAEGHSRASVGSYDIPNGGNGGTHSVTGTSSISSNGDRQNCCCIGSSGVEMPWTTSYARTKLPVPSSLAKNRKSSPLASPTVGASGVEGHQQQQQQQQLPRYPLSAANRTNNNGHGLSQSTQPHDCGSDDYTSESNSALGAGYTNGFTHKSSSNTGSRSSNGEHRQLEPAEESTRHQDTSPRCSTVVCCYSNSFGVGGGNKKQPAGSGDLQQCGSDIPDPVISSVGYVQQKQQQQQHQRNRSIGFSTTTLDRLRDGAGCDSTGGWLGARRTLTASGTRVGSELGDDTNEPDGDDDLSALVTTTGGSDGTTSGRSYRNGGDDLNLNSKNAPRHLHRSQQVPQGQRWQPGQGGANDVNINNFEKRKISTEQHGIGGVGGVGSISTSGFSARIDRTGGSSGGVSVGVGGGRNITKQNQSTPIGDLCVDELSSTSSLSPRSASPAVQHATTGCVLTPDSPTTGQLHPPPIATPFGQRRRALQPPSSLPVVKSYSFHRVPSDAFGSASPTTTSGSPSHPLDGPTVGYPALNRSFRNTNHSRRLQYGYVDDVINSDRQNGTPPVTRKSSLPVLGSSGSHTPPGGRYLHLTSSRTSSIDECYPFDKSSCQPECVLTPRSHRKLPCSDALNEIRLQSLNKYCNQLLGRGVVTFTGADSGLSTVAGSAHDRVTARAIDELEDLSFIDSSDLSSTGDDGAVVEPPYTDGHRRAHQRKRHPSINATIVSDGNLPTTVSGTLASTGHPASGGGGSERIANRNNHADSTSSDDPNHVCSGVTQLTRRNSDHQWQQQPVAVLKYRAQCTHNGSNASDDYPAARYCAELGVAGASSQPNTGVSFHGVQAEPVDGVLSEVVDRRGDTNNNYHRSNSDVDSDQLRHHHQQQHQQQQQKYTSTPANNSAGHSVRVGGVGVEPGRPGGVGEQTPDNSCTSPLSHVGLRPPQGYASSGCPSPDGSPAGLNCFGRSGTQLHGSGGVAADRSIMEKRNNTLDRLQRLVKKTTSSSSEKPSNSASGAGSNATTGGGGSKTERLRELTELLKGNRGPPVPPPRRPKHANSVERTFDRQNVTLSTSSLIDTGFLHGADSSLPESQLLKAKESRSVDIPYRFADGAGQRMSTPSSPLTEHKPVNLRANVSTSNLEALHEPPEAKPALGDECKSECILKDADDLFTKLSRPESRTIVGSYTQKTIPFRSASFSQVDYSSGKYIRSALGALKNSILKSRDQQQSSVDSNTIPRSSSKALEAARSCSPTELCGDQTDQASQPEPDTDVAKLTIKKTELNINLAPLDDYGRYFEDRLEGKDLSSNRNSDIETIVEDPVAEHDENVENELHQCAPGTNMSVLQASEMVLEPLVEEGIPITPTSLSKDDECLQQATTCLIPVPVYDCVVSEWSTARPSEQWIDASTTEYGKFSDCLDSIKEVNESAISDNPGRVHSPEKCHETSGHSDTITVETPPQIVEPQDSVELSEDGATSDPADLNDDSRGLGIASLLCTPPVSIICTEPESNEYTTIVDGTAPTHKVSVVLGDGNEIEVVEVRKRHSNNEDTGDPLNCRLSNDVDEKRRLESRKSRRKGIYFQWPAIDGNSELESDNNDTPAVDEAGVSWNPEALAGQVTEKDSSLDLSGESFTDLSGKDPGDRVVRSPERYLLDPITPDSDSGKPVWPKGNRRQSLTYQSSDEKDDTLPVPALPVRSLKTLLLRSDSVSDNESDRASSRDRTSASPAPGSGDPDPKRYSKRPLRGPYGQMLEAEMKKPTTKVQYSEILEELTRTEGTHRPNSTGARNRGVCSQSMDETNDRHAAKAGSKPRKTSANLPVPTHVRTASSPSKLSDSSGTRSASPSKRYLCNIDQRSTDSDRSEKSTGKLESKKLSLDSHLQSEKPTKPGKQRSGSSASEKQQKRSLDEVRLSQSSRTPSERSFTLAVTPEAPKGLAASPELLAELLKGSSEKLVTEQLGTASGAGGGTNASNALPSAVLNCLDTRTHVVVELFNTEKSYVESLQTIVLKYLNQLKSPENSGLVDVQTVDEIFFMVPAILNIHERFLEELRRRLDSWDKMQMIGDAFVDVFSRPVILDTYTSFVNNWNRAKDAIRSARQKCPAFARFLEAMAREHKGKLSLDNLLIKPVQKFPNYELIFTRLIKHTDVGHPDQKPLQEALKLVHDILMFLNCKEKEALENGQRETVLRELEGVIEGMNELVTPERAFLLFDLVSMPSGQVTRKERGFFLFNDLLVITSIKRRSGTIRKTNMTCPGSVASTLDTNKYKYLTKISLDDLEIVKSKDENVRRIMKEIEHLTEDSGKLIQMSDIAASLRCPHAPLEEAVRELQREIQRQLAERQTNDAQLNVLELTWNTSNGIQNMTVVFSKPEKRTQWEEIFAEAKQKLANSLERCQIPEFFVSVPIRKTRAGLQFTCASPTLGAQKDVWVCNSDGYVGQVCVLSLVPEPSVTSCNGVCNARILCVSSVPASDERSTNSALMNVNISIVDASIAPSKSNNCSVNSPAKSNDTKASFKSTDTSGGQTRSLANSEANVQLDSGSSSDDSDAESQPERTVSNQPGTGLTANHRQQDSTASVTTTGEESENQQSTMWLGTEDGCIHVYNCTDNIRIKKNKIKIPHVSAVYSILYLDNRVFVSLANGDICVYSRDRCGWNVSSPLTVTVGTVTNPVVKLLNVHGKLWCAIQGTIKVLNTKTLQIDSQIQISNDSKPITNMTVLNDYVWISVQNSAHIKCCHHESFEVIFEVNLAPSVNKMLSNCDDIIRQHKAACLRVTSLLACKDLVWVGTSAGVLLTIGAHNVAKGSPLPTVTGLPHGHTGHVRFLTFVESPDGQSEMTSEGTGPVAASHHGQSSGKSVKPSLQELLVISGGDGYEDFRSAGNNTMSEVAGREDSTNHLLLWKV